MAFADEYPLVHKFSECHSGTMAVHTEGIAVIGVAYGAPLFQSSGQYLLGCGEGIPHEEAVARQVLFPPQRAVCGRGNPSTSASLFNSFHL